jgi:hypothetical protein
LKLRLPRLKAGGFSTGAAEKLRLKLKLPRLRTGGFSTAAAEKLRLKLRLPRLKTGVSRQGRRSQRGDIRLAFYHFSSDGFWKVATKGHTKHKSWALKVPGNPAQRFSSIEPLFTPLDEAGNRTSDGRRVVAVRLDPEFPGCLSDRAFLTRIRRVLIATASPIRRGRRALHFGVGMVVAPDDEVKSDGASTNQVANPVSRAARRYDRTVHGRAYGVIVGAARLGSA